MQPTRGMISRKLTRWLAGTVLLAALGAAAPASAATAEATTPSAGGTTDAPVPASEEANKPSPSPGVTTNGPVVSLGTAPRADEKAPAPFVGYRALILAEDAASVALFILGDRIERSSNGVGSVLMTAGLFGYALAGPITHFAHDNPVRGTLSLALRVALPLAGAYIGAQTATCSDGDLFCGLDELAKGFVIGAGVASLTDILLIAPYPPSDGVRVPPAAGPAAPPRAMPTTASSSKTVAIAPSLLVLPDRAMVGLGGSF